MSPNSNYKVSSTQKATPPYEKSANLRGQESAAAGESMSRLERFEGACQCRSGASLKDLMLAAAFRLKLEGYVEVGFNKTFEVNGRRVRVHVLAYDEFYRFKVVWCITRRSQLDLDRMAEAFFLIKEVLGWDCEVAIAIPQSLMKHVRKLVGMSCHVYMLDKNGIMWHHDANHLIQQPFHKNMGDMNALEDLAEPNGPIVSGKRNDFYLA